MPLGYRLSTRNVLTMRPPHRQPPSAAALVVRRARTPVRLAALLLVAGCAAPASLLDVDRLSQELQARGLAPERVVVPFELSDEMRQWAQDKASRTVLPADKLRALRDALMDPDQMKIEYAWGYTGTATEVFEERRANCLSFTNLFLGMARELGVPVFFLAIDRVETYRKAGDLVVVSDHVAVAYGDTRTDLLVFDFSPYQNEGYRAVRPISDLTAIAMFYSNRGAEMLQEGRVYDAASWLRTAVTIDPELSPAWVNLGVVLRRAGDLEGAEDAYKHALEIDPRSYSAYQNLAALLQLQERHEEAAGFLEVLQKTPTRNPYSYLSLGDISLRSGRLEEARRFYRRAVGLSGDDAEIFAALGQLAIAQGDLRTARKMLRKARKIDGENPRAVRLANLLESGRSRPGQS